MKLENYIPYEMSAWSPSTRREWIEIENVSHPLPARQSPSTRREWIEIGEASGEIRELGVSLHTEGVD